MSRKKAQEKRRGDEDELIGTLLAAVSAAALLATPAMADKLKIGAAVYGLKAEYMQLWSAALKAHPAVKKGEVDVTVFDGNYTALTQQDQINTMITQKYDAIIFVPIDAEAGATPVQAAHDAGIPVIGSNTRVHSDLLTSYVGSDDVVSGYLEGKSVLDRIGCKGNVVIIEGPIGQSAQISRLEGNKKALAECPNVKVIEDQTANWSRAEAQKLMENWLTAHPGQINGVIGQNDEMALGAIEAIKEAKLNLKDFPTAGIDGISDALRAVKAGEMTSILQDAVGQAQGALDLAIFYAKKGDYKPQSEIWAKYKDMPWNSGKDKIYNVPWTPVTTANVDALLARGRSEPLKRRARAEKKAYAPSLPGRVCLPPKDSEGSIKMSDAPASIDLDFSLKGKRALVTGGASGIGAAICSAFAAKGARVAVVDLNVAAAEAKAKAIGGGATAFACDVSDPASVQKTVDGVWRRLAASTFWSTAPASCSLRRPTSCRATIGTRRSPST